MSLSLEDISVLRSFRGALDVHIIQETSLSASHHSLAFFVHILSHYLARQSGVRLGSSRRLSHLVLRFGTGGKYFDVSSSLYREHSRTDVPPLVQPELKKAIASEQVALCPPNALARKLAELQDRNIKQPISARQMFTSVCT